MHRAVIFTKMTLFYVLPKKNYFAQGMRGRVAHAIGLGEAFSRNGVSTEIVSGPGAREYFQNCSVSEIKPKLKRLWIISLLKKLSNIAQSDSANKKTVLIRYATTNSWLVSLYIKLFVKSNALCFGFEINSLGYHQTLSAPNFIRRVLLYLECKIIEKADFCYVVSEQLKQDIISASNDVKFASRIVVVPNGGPDAKNINHAKSDQNNFFNFAFFGIYQEYYNIEVILEAFRILSERHENIRLHFYGDGPKLSLINKASSENKFILEHGRYKLDDLVNNDLTSTNTVLLLPFGDENENQIRSPIKLFEYMSIGLPIVATDCAQISAVLQNDHNGLLVPSSDTSSWVNCMEEIYKNNELRLNIQKNVIASYSSHTWQSRANTLFDFITNLNKSGC